MFSMVNPSAIIYVYHYHMVNPYPTLHRRSLHLHIHVLLSQAEAPAGISVAEVEALVLSVAGEVTGHSVDAQDAAEVAGCYWVSPRLK